MSEELDVFIKLFQKKQRKDAMIRFRNEERERIKRIEDEIKYADLLECLAIRQQKAQEQKQQRQMLEQTLTN